MWVITNISRVSVILKKPAPMTAGIHRPPNRVVGVGVTPPTNMTPNATSVRLIVIVSVREMMQVKRRSVELLRTVLGIASVRGQEVNSKNKR